MDSNTADANEAEQPAVTATSSKSYLDDGFVFGLEDSGLERPKGKNAQLVIEGDSLETQPWQIAIVSATLITHAIIAGNAVLGIVAANGGNVMTSILHSIVMFVSSWILADLGSGLLHFGVDNYGNGRTPVMGSIIAAFQGHHSAPWTITYRGFCNNVYKLCTPFGIVTTALVNALTGPYTTFFLTTFCFFEVMSQEFHKWSHMTPKECPTWVNWLQDIGLTIGRKPHALHHLAPYEGNYCIISGICNPFLDKSGFFRRMEHFIYKWNGVESNSWKLDPELRERTLKGDYRLVQ